MVTNYDTRQRCTSKIQQCVCVQGKLVFSPIYTPHEQYVRTFDLARPKVLKNRKAEHAPHRRHTINWRRLQRRKKKENKKPANHKLAQMAEDKGGGKTISTCV